MSFNLMRTPMKNSAIILAGGTGIRIKSNIPKQFLSIRKNITILEYSINTFKQNLDINEIILVCHQDYIKSDIVQKFNSICTIVTGGKTRTKSTIKGLLACDQTTDNILIHDAARPYISQKLINKCLENLKNYDASIPVLSSSDALINIDGSKINYLNKKSTKLIQTPQGFNYKKILNALKNNQKNYLDDFSALLNHNKNIKYILFDGDENNFKITTESDLQLARKISNEI